MNTVKRHMPALDGLRGIAIAAVMTFHYGPFCTLSTRPFLYGYLGVDLFFVLSGFLISGILLDSRESAHYFKTFYARRILRIFPVYYAFLVASIVLARLLTSGGHSHQYWLYFLYVQNWWPGNGMTQDYYLGHLWSLAVEEQFYLFWPLVIWLCPARYFPWVCGAIVAVVLEARLYCAGFLGINTIWKVTPFRMDSLCLGGLAAYLLRNDRAAAWLKKRWPVLAAVGAIWFMLAQRNAEYVGVSSYTAAALTFACVVFWAASASPFALTLPILRALGKYSYAMYLFHLPVHIFVSPFLWRWASHSARTLLAARILYMPAMFLLVYGMAALSWRLFEEPILRLKRYFRYDETPRAADALMSVHHESE